MTTLIPRIERPELFFGFVAPIGSDLEPVVRAFKSYFERLKYDAIDIKVTDVFQALKRHIEPPDTLKTFPIESRYRTYIKYGDQLRDAFADDSLLAATTIVRAAQKRSQRKVSEPYSNAVYLFHQFKRREEVELLRAVYGDAFFQISIYSRRGARVDTLARRFASHASNINAYRAAAEDLVQIDESEAHAHGQRVGSIFHDADFIVNLDQHEPNAEEQVARFCELLFSSNRVSPTRMEHGMHLAKAAALRSVDLSRQVGACILDANGQIICLGANEVPKATGGTYWSNGQLDDRDFKRGYDSNERRKKNLLSEIIRALGAEDKMDQLMADPNVKDSRFMDALEYSRVVHAEMNAICDAARAGRAVENATLYCTTFPCHMCSKHIIASGLGAVVFLEPYPKSLTSELHGDAVEIECGDRGQYKDFPSVKFQHFSGVTPRRYRELFERGKRKDETGAFVEYIGGIRRPLIDLKFPIYAQPELMVIDGVKTMFLKKLKQDETILDDTKSRAT